MVNSNYNNNINELKLPIINLNIKKKYNYPHIEKSEPTTFIYNVIKNMLDEHHNLNKNINIRKKRFEWDEFQKFTSYQIFTLLSLNKVIIIFKIKDVMKLLETKFYPRKVGNLDVKYLNTNERINEEEMFE